MRSKTPLSILGMGVVHNIVSDSNCLHAFTNEHNVQLASLFPKTPLRRVPYYARMGLMACAKALSGNEHLSKQSMGLVVGSAYAGIKMSMDFMDSILDAQPRLSSPTAFSHAVNNMGAGLLSLYLGLQGPCQTVTQFALSFAGALQLATTLIYANRAPYVLVGCMDEYEERFNKICLDNNALNEKLFEGAVFFLVTKESDNLPKISVSFNELPLQNKKTSSALHYAVASFDAISKKEQTSIVCQDKGISATIEIWT